MDLLTCAKDIYSGYQYNGRWAIDTFWRRANTLDACIRFINAANSRWPADPDVQQMVNDMINRLYTESTTEGQFFQPWLDDVSMWADDFFWCGVASLSAYDFLLSRYGYPGDPGWAKAQRYLTIAQTSWLRLVGTGYDLATEATPVPHGCRNSTASPDASDNPIGIKNTGDQCRTLPAVAAPLQRAEERHAPANGRRTRLYCEDGLRPIPVVQPVVQGAEPGHGRLPEARRLRQRGERWPGPRSAARGPRTTSCRITKAVSGPAIRDWFSLP